VLAERLCHRYIAPEETAFEAIRRIPGGSVFAARPGARRVTRYWDPAPPDRPLAWASEDELEHFDEIFERAVRRCTRMGQPGVFLSGGLDSIAVAAFAADLSAQAGVARPLALSLAFPHPECAEEDMQRDIANGLGMDQEMIPLDVAAGRPGLLRAALAESASWSFPLCTPWTPAYRHLGLRGHARGCRTILTGRGGDERLALSLSCAADMIRDLDVSGLWDHLRGQMKSYRLSRLKIIRTTLWTFGARPLFSGMVDYVAHDWWRRRRLERFRAATPPWLSPDPSLKRELDARVETLLSPAWPPDGFHAHDIRSALTHPLTAAEFEESHELARRVGVRIVHPFWDVDLVNLLFRVPPTLACRDGAASKSLIRQPMEKRFPGFGLRQQKKVMATNYFISLLQAQSGAAWTALGGTPALGALGVVDPAAVQGLMNTWTHGAVPVTAGNVWSIMNVESWLRGHVTA
jgi:asparagine synthetase B (glutamine-hydrolysing)